MRPWKLVIGLLVVVLSVGGLYWLLYYDSPAEQSRAEEGRTRFTKPHFVGYHEGVRQWSLRANLIEEEQPNRPDVLLLHGITEGILYRDGEEDLRFQAQRGVWRALTGVLELEGDVIFWDETDELLVSERVVWYSREENLVSPVRATVRYDGQRAEADELEVRLADEIVTLNGNVVWTTQDGFQVKAQSAVYTGDELAFTELLEPVRFQRTQPSKVPHEG